MKVLFALMVASVVVASASAAAPVRLVFDRPEATPHTLVTAKTAGNGALKAHRKWMLRAYLADEQLVPLGRISVNHKGNGRLVFGVPNVPPGKFEVVLRGLRGASSPRAVGSFRVLEGSAVRTCEEASYWDTPTEEALARWPRVGPLHIAIDTVASSDPSWRGTGRDRITGQYFTKAGINLESGPAVTLVVAAEDRRRVALAYKHSGPRRVTALDAAATLEPCAGEPYTGFSGGFVWVEPLCAHFELRVESRPDPLQFTLPLGRPCT